MNLQLPADDQPTQCQHPNHAVARTTVATLIAGVPVLMPVLTQAVGAKWAVVVIGGVLAGNGLITRLLAVPEVESFLRQVIPFLAAKPNDGPPLRLSAADVIALDASTGVQASDSARTVTALVIPWGQTGHTTAGPLAVTRGGVRLPADLTRCKLYSDHTGTPHHRPVGHALGYHVDDAGLHMTFAVARTPDGDAAILDIRERVRDAVSAELAGIRRQGNTVTDSIMTGVALVSTPAFSDARVTDLHAQHTEGNPPMNPEQYLRAMIAAGASEAEARASAVVRFGQAAVDGVASAAVADSAPTPPAEVTPPPASAPAPAPAPAAGGDAASASYTPPRPAVVPSGIQVIEAAPPQLSLSQAVDTLRAIQTGNTGSIAHAALANITGSALVDATPPQWLGELWSGVATPRELIPLLNRRDLTSWRIQAYTWTQKPMVASYAGDKTEIPTNPVAIAPYEAEAVRWAGGHDLDRKFYDFGDRGIIESYWRAMNESYAVVTDQAAGAWLVANAKPIVAPTATNLLRAMIATRRAVRNALRVTPSYYLANPDDEETLLDYTNDTLPAYLSMFNVDPKTIIWTPTVPQGTMVAGAKPAATWHELPGSPLRVEAEHLSHGGKDAALFGYSALTLDQPDGLVKVEFDAAP